MFLTKHAPHSKNKEKNKPKRILGGWEDDEQENTSKPTVQTAVNVSLPSPPKVHNLLEDPIFEQPQSLPPPVSVPEKGLSWDQLNQREDIECEKRVVEEVVQPGGIRIKPSDGILNALLRDSRGMSVAVIGWLLLSKLEVNYPFNIKAKTLYAIEFLSKKEGQYKKFFSGQAGRMREYPTPEDNQDNYMKILNSVCGMLGAGQQAEQSGSKMEFVDPGYNNSESVAKPSFSAFLYQNAPKNGRSEGKRAIIGPNQVKNKPVRGGQVDLLVQSKEEGVGLGQSGDLI